MPNKKDSGRDQRRSPRYPVKLEVRFRSARDLLDEHATNISKGGLFVRTPRKLDLDERVALSIRLPNGQALTASARVAHVHAGPGEPGVGLEFEGDNQEFNLALDRYLAELAESAEG